MKKTIIILIFMVFTFSGTMAFASADKSAIPAKTENNLSEAEISRLTKRVEEIRKMDKSDLTFKERSVLKKELKGINENVRTNSGVIYISGGTLLLIILLIIILL